MLIISCNGIIKREMSLLCKSEKEKEKLISYVACKPE